MIIRNNWIKSNIETKCKSRTTPFKVDFDFYKLHSMPFKVASYYNAHAITQDFGDKRLFLALSGGSDSEYILRLFAQLHIVITPIIVRTPMNWIEIQYAERVCKQLYIEPIFIDYAEKDIIQYFCDTIYNKLNSDRALNTIYALLAAEHAQKLGGMLINGDSILNDFDIHNIIIPDFEFFPDVLFPDVVIPFYYYTLEICHALLANVRMDDDPKEFKARVYNLDWRPKLDPIYSWDAWNIYTRMTNTINSKPSFNGGTVKEFLATLEQYRI